MKKFAKILVICLMLITIISFSYQTSFGAIQVAQPNITSSQMGETAALQAAVVLAAGIVSAAYALGYALGRAYGHHSFGGEEVLAYNPITHNPSDFSSFDN